MEDGRDNDNIRNDSPFIRMGWCNPIRAPRRDKGEDKMTIEEMKAMAARIPAEINKRNLGVFDEVAGPNAVDHAAPPGVPSTAEGTKQFLGMMLAAFPDLHYTVDQVVAEGDKVVHYQTAHGTMKESFLGMPATGKSATWSEIHIVRFANGKVTDHWAVVDQLGMLQQLGLAPAPGG